MMKFSKFKIKDLFNSATGDTDLKQRDINNIGLPVITSGINNYGILGLTDHKAKIFPKNTITVDMFGNAYYRDFSYKMVTHARVFALIPTRELLMSSYLGLYIQTCLNKLALKYSYDNMCSFNKIKDEYLFLPITKDKQIDFNYIHDRISKLEHDRISKLEHYLKITGLNDYHLTNEDKTILSYNPQFKDFKIIDLFKIVNTNNISKSQMMKLPKGSTPYLTASESNNAVSTYIKCPSSWINEGNCVFVGGKTMVVTYQEKDFCSNDSHNLALYLKNHQFRSPLIQLYFVGAITKSLSKKYSWNDSISRRKIKRDIISLPVSSKTNNIDYKYMEQYIKVIEKLTIKSTVDYKDQIIRLTNQVID